MTAKITDLADFESDAFGYFEMLKWATSDEGGLPDVSARPFAAWLDGSWNDFDDGFGTLTNEDILKGAVAFWTGRS
jgi:hypothetical protein